ncbi:hypothetical protein GCM10009662_49810 [Catellatospora coxensis]
MIGGSTGSVEGSTVGVRALTRSPVPLAGLASADGGPEGSGATEGPSDGAPEGAAEGASDGSGAAVPDGSGSGDADGPGLAAPGSTEADGSGEGSPDGGVDGSGSADADGSGAGEPDGSGATGGRTVPSAGQVRASTNSGAVPVISAFAPVRVQPSGTAIQALLVFARSTMPPPSAGTTALASVPSGVLNVAVTLTKSPVLAWSPGSLNTQTS